MPTVPKTFENWAVSSKKLDILLTCYFCSEFMMLLDPIYRFEGSILFILASRVRYSIKSQCTI